MLVNFFLNCECIKFKFRVNFLYATFYTIMQLTVSNPFKTWQMNLMFYGYTFLGQKKPLNAITAIVNGHLFCDNIVSIFHLYLSYSI